MLAAGHSLSGLATGYGACLAYSAISGHELYWLVPHVAAAVVAGWSLWPDIDSPRSTVSTSLGVVTRLLHELVVIGCAAVYYATRAEADDPKKPVIHRGFTHTIPGALLAGLFIATVCALWPHWGTVVVLGISLHWAARALYIPNAIDKKLSLSRLKGKSPPQRIGVILYHRAGQSIRRRATDIMKLAPLPGKYLRSFGRGGTLAICLGGAFLFTGQTTAFDTPAAGLLGLAAVVGCLTHCCGDSCTEAGVCWRFPFKHRSTGRRWQPTRWPKWLAFRAGAAFEIAVMYPLLVVAVILAAPGGFELVLHLVAAWRNGGGHVAALRFAPWQKTPPLLT